MRSRKLGAIAPFTARSKVFASLRLATHRRRRIAQTMIIANGKIAATTKYVAGIATVTLIRWA
jgi:hypothetical protein